MNERLASAQASKATRYSNRLSVLEAQIDGTLLDSAQGAGMLYDVSISNITQISPVLNRHTQTITHLGLSKAELTTLIQIMARYGGYRLVPIGNALSFSNVWDGVDLMDHMTRQLITQT